MGPSELSELELVGGRGSSLARAALLHLWLCSLFRLLHVELHRGTMNCTSECNHDNDELRDVVLFVCCHCSSLRAPVSCDKGRMLAPAVRSDPRRIVCSRCA